MTSAELVDADYLEWIFDRVGLQGGSVRITHWNLLAQLLEKPFVWIVPNDDNRIIDGKNIRNDFLKEGPMRSVNHLWLDEPCSVLELILGLAQRLSFDAEGEPSEWFWRMIKNLGLDKFKDPVNNRQRAEIDAKLDVLIWRQYDYDGRFGGLFPLDEPFEDQRDVELWYQMSAYLRELD